MDLNTLWFILIAVLFSGFFLLEGFDYGVGMLLPFLGKNDDERRLIINAIGPFWDGNEVWMLTAGGAMFAVCCKTVVWQKNSGFPMKGKGGFFF